MTERHTMDVQPLPEVVRYVLTTFVASCDERTAMATYAAHTESVGRGEITLEGLSLGFGDHPDHLAQGLSSRSDDGTPTVREIVEANHDALQAYVTSAAKAVKVAHVVAGAQVDATVTRDHPKLAGVSVSQDLGELDALHRKLRVYCQLKPWTQFRGQTYALDAHTAFVPRDADGNIKQGYAEMRKDNGDGGEYVRPLIAYARTGSGKVHVSRHYGEAVGAAATEAIPEYTYGGPGKREELWEGINRFPRMVGDNPDDVAAWIETHRID